MVMDTPGRLVLALLLVVACGIITAWYRRRVGADAARGATGTDGTARWPELPLELRGDASAPAWVIFSTPLCASCAGVQSDLEERFPLHHVVRVDATQRPDLAARYDVRRAPTTLVADASGRILDRLVGAERVREFDGSALR